MFVVCANQTWQELEKTTQEFGFNKAVRGFHVDRRVWLPHFGQRLRAEREHGNAEDQSQSLSVSTVTLELTIYIWTSTTGVSLSPMLSPFFQIHSIFVWPARPTPALLFTILRFKLIKDNNLERGTRVQLAKLVLFLTPNSCVSNHF